VPAQVLLEKIRILEQAAEAANGKVFTRIPLAALPCPLAFLCYCSRQNNTLIDPCLLPASFPPAAGLLMLTQESAQVEELAAHAAQLQAALEEVQHEHEKAALERDAQIQHTQKLLQQTQARPPLHLPAPPNPFVAGCEEEGRRAKERPPRVWLRLLAIIRHLLNPR